MKLLLDTHIWIWSVARPELIVGKARKALENAENPRWLSPISVWEAQILMERGRVTFSRDASSILREALRVSRVLEASLTHEIVLESRRLWRFHEDPADRFLVATARVLDFTLVTADRAILESGACSLLPNV
jgi:PIN domain nuclease of toxin-antitoxin system